MHRMIRRFAFTLLGGFLFLMVMCPAAYCVEEEKPGAKAETAAPDVSYPGLEEVVPRSSAIDAEAVEAIAVLTEIRGPEAFLPQYENLSTAWERLQESLGEYGPQKDWPVNRLLTVRDQVENQSRNLQQLLEQVAVPLKHLEETRKLWTERLDYWESWRQALEDVGARIPRQTFNKVRSSTAEVLSLATKKTADLVQLQEKISRLRENILQRYMEVDTDVAALRQEPFKRNAHPLFSVEFIQQFDLNMLERMVDGVQAAFQLDLEFFKRQGWLLVLQAILVFGLIYLFAMLELSTSQKTDDWQFIFQRPIAAALFVALAAPRLFYVTPPPALLQLVIVIIATASAARLACQLLQEGNQRTLIYALAGFFVTSKALTTFAMPLSLYRVFLVLVTLVGIPFFSWIGRRHKKHFQGSVDHYLLWLRLGQAILVTSLIAQISGYATFSQNLIESSIGTVFLMLFALMALRIVEGAVELFFLSTVISSTRFVKNLGPQTTQRFTRIAKGIIFVATTLYLLEIWGLFDSIGAAWNTLMAIEYSIGEFHVSVKMLFLILIVLYTSMLISWFIQSFLESQVFFGKPIDRGVRDAIKKLTHYAVVLVGFLVAMTMSGIDLQNFAILAGAFGIGIGFGLQDIVNNFVSGLILLFERPVKVGDAVIIDGQWGAISKIGMRSTVVETWDRSELIVPNSQMISEKVLNWTLSSNVSRVTVKVGVRYGSDLGKVVEILNAVGDGHSSVVSDPPPSAIFTEFGDSSINFELRVWVDDIKNRLALISDLGIAIDREFRKAGIEIPFPQRDLHLKSMAPEIGLAGTTGVSSKETGE